MISRRLSTIGTISAGLELHDAPHDSKCDGYSDLSAGTRTYYVNSAWTPAAIIPLDRSPLVAQEDQVARNSLLVEEHSARLHEREAYENTSPEDRFELVFASARASGSLAVLQASQATLKVHQGVHLTPPLRVMAFRPESCSAFRFVDVSTFFDYCEDWLAFTRVLMIRTVHGDGACEDQFMWVAAKRDASSARLLHFEQYLFEDGCLVQR